MKFPERVEMLLTLWKKRESFSSMFMLDLLVTVGSWADYSGSISNWHWSLSWFVGWELYWIEPEETAASLSVMLLFYKWFFVIPLFLVSWDRFNPCTFLSFLKKGDGCFYRFCSTPGDSFWLSVSMAPVSCSGGLWASLPLVSIISRRGLFWASLDIKTF